MKRIPDVVFRISYSFHKWFLYHHGDFSPEELKDLRTRVSSLAMTWRQKKRKILLLIQKYTGISWKCDKIDVYFFRPPNYFNPPCISDPILIKFCEPEELTLLFLIHELVHVNTIFSEPFCYYDEEVHEAVAYFVAIQVLRDVLGGNTAEIEKMGTTSWPFNYTRLRTIYGSKINLRKKSMLLYLEDGLFKR